MLLMAITSGMQGAGVRTPGRIAILGDSNTWAGGDDCSRPEGWSHRFARRFPPGFVRSYARSGATWSHTRSTKVDTLEYTEVLSDCNVILNQIHRLRGVVEANPEAAPSTVIIFAGTNDAWFHNRRPRLLEDFPHMSDNDLLKASPDTMLSLRAAIRMDIALLRSFLPQARIVLFTPLQSTAPPPGMIESVASIIVEEGRAAGVETLRLDILIPIKAETERQELRYTKDGTHTNKVGAIVVAELLSSLLYF